jgi:hypothetical protein
MFRPSASEPASIFHESEGRTRANRLGKSDIHTTARKSPRRWHGSMVSVGSGRWWHRQTLAAFVRRADEGTLSLLMVEAGILLAASRSNPTTVLRDAGATYKVDTEAIAAKVKQEFAAKDRAKKTALPAAKTSKKAAWSKHAFRGGISPPLIIVAELRIAAECSGDVERLCTKIPPADHNPESNPYLDCGGRQPSGAKRLYVPERSIAEEPTILPNKLSRTFITDIKRSRPYLVRLFQHQSTRFVQA